MSVRLFSPLRSLTSPFVRLPKFEIGSCWRRKPSATGRRSLSVVSFGSSMSSGANLTSRLGRLLVESSRRLTSP